MAVDTATVGRARPRLGVRARSLPAWAFVAGLVALSSVVRAAAASTHSTPRYFPDEFLYSQLARSLAAGRGVRVLDEPSRFPALLEPLVTAPVWLSGNPELAYRLTQALHAVAMSLAAVPVYLLARRLGLRGPGLWLPVLATVLSPDLLYVGYTTADAIGYALALGAVAAGVVALASSTARSQAAFLALTGLACFARIQYVALLAAFLLASVLAERGSLRRAVARHRLVHAAVGAGLVGALALGSGVLGRYGDVTSFAPSRAAAAWLPQSAFLLALASGAAIVPGALAWLSRPRGAGGAERRAFARLATLLLGLLLAAAAVMAVETESERFFERYLMVALPVLALAFACWVEEERPRRRIAAGFAIVLLICAARVPVSSFTVATGTSDSPFLLGVRYLEGPLGVDGAGLTVALVAGVGCLTAVWAALGRAGGSRVAGAVSLAVLASASLGAHLEDRALSDRVSALTLAPARGWVDATGADDVLLLQTAGSPGANAMTQVVWNASVRHGALLGDQAEPLDGAARRVAIGRDGLLSLGGRTLTGPLLVATAGTRTELVGATRRAGAPGFVLASPPAGGARLASLAQGLAPDGWFAARGTVTVWPSAARYARGVRLILSIPAGLPSATVDVRGAGLQRTVSMPGGGSATLELAPKTPAPWRLRLSARRPHVLADRRAVAAKLRLEEIPRRP
jgi:hypothetical protein